MQRWGIFTNAGIAAGLYNNLVREQPRSLPFWLNRQEHPSSRYISVVREDDGLLNFGCLVVPAWSQDMNHVTALRGRSRKIMTQIDHGLSKQDGELLLKILGKQRLNVITVLSTCHAVSRGVEQRIRDIKELY